MYVRLYPNSTKVMTLAPTNVGGDMIETNATMPKLELPEGMNSAELNFYKDKNGDGIDVLEYIYFNVPDPTQPTENEAGQ